MKTTNVKTLKCPVGKLKPGHFFYVSEYPDVLNFVVGVVKNGGIKIRSMHVNNFDFSRSIYLHPDREVNFLVE